jgi:hypothetical protein
MRQDRVLHKTAIKIGCLLEGDVVEEPIEARNEPTPHLRHCGDYENDPEIDPQKSESDSGENTLQNRSRESQTTRRPGGLEARTFARWHGRERYARHRGLGEGCRSYATFNLEKRCESVT